MSSSPSPLLSLPGAVAGEGVDAPVAAHYGSFTGEQRTLVRGDGFVDLSHRGVLRISGPDRLTYLHSMTTQHLESLAPGQPTEALILSPQGHVEHHLRGVDDGEAFTAHVEPGTIGSLAEFLDRMRFMMRVEVTDVTEEYAVAWRPDLGGRAGRAATVVETCDLPARPPASTTSSPATSWRSTPRPPARPAGCGPSRRCGSRAASRGSAWTPTTARSPTRWAGSALRSTSTRVATAARRRSPASTRWAARRGAWSCSTWTARRTRSPPRRHRHAAGRRRPRAAGRLRRLLGPPPRARPDRPGHGQAQRARRGAARHRGHAGHAGGPRRPRGRPARAPAAR